MRRAPTGNVGLSAVFRERRACRWDLGELVGADRVLDRVRDELGAGTGEALFLVFLDDETTGLGRVGSLAIKAGRGGTGKQGGAVGEGWGSGRKRLSGSFGFYQCV